MFDLIITKVRRISQNLPFVLWLLFYYVFFSLLFGGSDTAFLLFGIIYGVGIFASFSGLGEWLFRSNHGVREEMTADERELLIPMFNETYEQAKSIDPLLFGNIKLYIMETMEINAFAVGRGTLVITKGSIALLNVDSLRGLMAHEFGHFVAWDTLGATITTIGNVVLELFVRFLLFSANMIGKIGATSEKLFIMKIIRGILMGIYKGLVFIGDIILKSACRKAEYKADMFAHECGCGEELLVALKELSMLDVGEPLHLLERLRDTHPTTTSRIVQLEQEVSA